MIVVKLKGGLGNQMFQYAAGRALSIFHKVELMLDLSGFHNDNERQYNLDVFHGLENNRVKIIKKSMLDMLPGFRRRFRKKIQNHAILMEPSFSYDSNFLNYSNNAYLDGYWQSEKYFLKYKQNIRDDFQFKKSVVNKCKTNLELVKSVHSVAIHVRRGDYVSEEKISKIHNTLSTDYYINAMDVILDKVPNPHYLVFSDDPEWAEDNLSMINSVTFIGTDNSAEEDMYLMSNCRHHIIANSSFSWWAAWLNVHLEKLVIVPKKWFTNEEMNNQSGDLIPKKWIKI